MKISTARLKQIINEELFYREFHRKTEELTEVHSKKQRNYMCAMKDKKADERPKGLSKAEAGEMCTGPMKEINPRPGAAGLYGTEAAQALQDAGVALHTGLIADLNSLIRDHKITITGADVKRGRRYGARTARALVSQIKKDKGIA